MADLDKTLAYEIRVEGDYLNRPCVNVIHYQPFLTGGGPPVVNPTILDLLDSFRNVWRNSILANMSTDYRVNRYRGLSVIGAARDPADPNKAPVVEYGLDAILIGEGAADTGTQVFDECPSFNAVSVQKRTGFVDRNFRGGMRLPGMEKDAIDANNWDGVQFNALKASLQNLLIPLLPVLDSEFDMRISVFSRNVLADTVPAITSGMACKRLTAIVPREVISSQVSRKKRLDLP